MLAVGGKSGAKAFVWDDGEGGAVPIVPKYLRLLSAILLSLPQKSPVYRPRVYLLVAGIVAVSFLIVHLLVGLYHRRQTAELVRCIPEDALLVAEMSGVQGLRAWADTAAVFAPFAPHVEADSLDWYLSRIDSVARAYPILGEFFDQQPLMASLHLSGRDRMQWLFYLRLADKAPQAAWADSLLAEIPGRFGLRHRSRRSGAATIHEWADSTGHAFYFVRLRNVWAGSFSSLLVEDAVRAFGQKHPYPRMQRLLSLDAPAASLRLTWHLDRWPAVWSAWSPVPAMPKGTGWRSAVRFSDQSLHLDGRIAYDSDDWWAIGTGQQANASQADSLLPVQTAFAHRWACQDGEKLGERLLDFWMARQPGLQVLADTVETAGVDVAEDLYDLASQEVIIAWLPEGSGLEPLLILRGTDMQKGEKFWRKKLAEKSDIALKIDTVAGHHILPLPVKALAQLAWQAPGAPTAVSYAAFGQGYVVLGANRRTVDQWLTARLRGRTWAYTPRRHEAFAPLRQPVRYACVASLMRAWAWGVAPLNPTAAHWAETHKQQWLKYDLLTCVLDPNDHLRIVALMPPDHARQRKGRLRQQLLRVNIDQKLSAGPFAVIHHETKQQEWLVQDAATRLHLIGEKGDKKWSIPLWQPLSTDITQADLYQNAKLQYVFGAGNRLMALDRLGRAVRHFPLSAAPGTRIDAFCMTNPDRFGTKYFVLADDNAQVSVFERAGRLLPHWRNRAFPAEAVVFAQAFRLQDRPVFLLMMNDGTAYLQSLEGKSLPGFPLRFDAPVSSRQCAVTLGEVPEQTTVTLLTDLGEVCTFELSGTIRRRYALPHASDKSTFRFCPDQNGGSRWMAARQDGPLITVLTPEGRELFTANTGHATPKTVRFFDFGSALEVVAVCDEWTAKTWLYYLNGESLLPQPMDTARPVWLRYAEEHGWFEVAYLRDQTFYVEALYRR